MKQLFFILLMLISLISMGQKKGVGKASVRKQAQKNTSFPSKDTVHTKLRMVAQNYGDSIVVRWAPGDAVSWLLLQKKGYILRRTVFSKNAKNEFKLVDSSSRVIHPWTLDGWANYFKATRDTFGAMAAQLAYGKYISLSNGKEGNTLNSILDKYDEQQNRFTIALLLADFNPQVANGFGFRFVEKGVKKNLHYLFTVVPAQTEANLISDTGRSLIRGNDIYKKDTLSNVGVIAGDSVIHLFWPKGTSVRSAYSGYFIERSEDGQHFKRLNRLPFVPSTKTKDPNQPVQYTDSVYPNYKKYYYRITGINAFGDISFPSKQIMTMGIDLLGPKAPVISQIKNVKGVPKIHLSWVKKHEEKDFKGYIIGRSNKLEGPYDPINKELLSFNTNEFTDNNPVEGLPNYYIVAALDTAMNASRSIPAYVQLEDHTPPAKPIGLKGSIDSAGIVTVQWDLGKEMDLAGYKLFFANEPNHQFTPLTGELYQDTLFTDSITLKTLSKKIYYKLIAYDLSMNPSPFSDLLMLNKPDIIPPVKAIIRHFLVTDSGVVIKWYPSPSDDAACQRIFRKNNNEEKWELLAQTGMKDSTYSDKKTVPLQTYQYTIETIDSSGLNSGKSFGLRVRTYENGYEGSVTAFEVSFLKDKNRVSLKWKPLKEEVNYYILFRDKDASGMKMAGNIKGNVFQYEEEVTTGTYRYAIKAVYTDGKESALSEIKFIRVL